MLIVTGEIEIDPKDVEKLRPAALTMMAETAKEKGCRFYRFYQDIEDPGRIRVYEEWESDEDLHAHRNAPHMAEWRAALEKVEVKSRRIQVLRGATASDM